MAREERAHIVLVGSRTGDTQVAGHRVGVTGDTRREAPKLAKLNSLFFFLSPKRGEEQSQLFSFAGEQARMFARRVPTSK